MYTPLTPAAATIAVHAPDPLQSVASERNEATSERNDDPSFLKNPKALRPRLGLSGVFGKYHVTPRGLTADLLNKMICVDGIVMPFVQIPARSEKYRDSAKRDFLRSRSLYVVDFLRSSHKCIRPLFPYRCRL